MVQSSVTDSGAVAKELDDQALSHFVEEQSKNWLTFPFDLSDCPGTDTNEGDDSLFGFNEPDQKMVISVLKLIIHFVTIHKYRL